MSADHERLLSMTAALRRSLASAGRITGPPLDELAAIVVAHAKREQVGLFAGLRDAGVDEDYVERFEHELQSIDDLVARSSIEPGAVRALIELVEDHIVREETDTFPAARQLLDPAQWDAVDHAVSDAVAR